MGGKGVALGTDANGLSPLLQNPKGVPLNYQNGITVASQFGCPAGCPTLSQFKVGDTRMYDFESDGIATYGLLPDFLQATSQVPPAPTAQIAALFHSAEDTIEMWEQVVVAAKGVPQPEAVYCYVFDDGYTNTADHRMPFI
jgi:hypothetical protein